MFEEVTGLELADADPGASFVDLGLDSLFLTQAALQVHKRFGVKVTFRQLMESFTTLDSLAAHLDEQLPPEAEAPPAAPAPASRLRRRRPRRLPPRHSRPRLALPAMSPLPAAGTGVVRHVIDQQLRLMAAQLALLTGGARPAAPRLRPARRRARRSRAGPGRPASAELPAAAPPSRQRSPPSDPGPTDRQVRREEGLRRHRAITHAPDELTPEAASAPRRAARRYNARTEGRSGDPGATARSSPIRAWSPASSR